MPLTILHVEDSRIIADAVRDTLEAQAGWRVEMCADGYAAFKRLVSAVRYDLLILDNGLPNVRGIELARYARQLPRYRKTPIIMFSADDLWDEAQSAGINLFLRKPDEIDKLVDAVRRLAAG